MKKILDNIKDINFANIKISTYVSFVVIVLTIVNYILTAMGKPVVNISEGTLTAWVTVVIGILGIAYGWWKNQSVTKPAQVVDDVLAILKDGKITIDELNEFIAEHSYTEVSTPSEDDVVYQ